MGIVLSVYCGSAFKDFLLPAVNNANHSVVLSKSIFGLESDLELKMEVLDHEWSFKNSSKYELLNENNTAVRESFAGKILEDGDLIRLEVNNRHVVTILVKSAEDLFSVYEKYYTGDLKGVIRIGSSENSDITCDFLNLISSEHALIRKAEGSYILEDIGTNGTFVNNERIQGSIRLSFGDRIDIYGLRIVVLGDFLAVNASSSVVSVHSDLLKKNVLNIGGLMKHRRNTERNNVFHRSPQHIAKIDTEPINIDAPPNPKQLSQPSLIMAIGPALSMALPMVLGSLMTMYASQKMGYAGSAFMYTGLITSFSSAILGTIWALVNMKNAKKKFEADEAYRNEAYRKYLEKCEKKIQEKYDKNTAALRDRYRAADECCTYNELDANLWNKNIHREGFLKARLGVGKVPFQAEVIVPKEKFTLISDELLEMPAKIKEKYAVINDVPVTVDFERRKLVGLVGGENKKGAISVVHDIVTQIAAGNSYTDVKLLIVYDKNETGFEGNWNFAEWLPHVWNGNKNFRYVADSKETASDVFYELTKQLRIRMEEAEDKEKEKAAIPRPYYILILANPEMLEGEVLSKYVLKPKPEYGLSTILCVENYEELPNECEFIIENDERFQGVYNIYDDPEDRTNIRFDAIAPAVLEQFARRISRLEVREMESGGDIPQSLTFFDMYGVQKLSEFNVLDRWKKDRTYDNIKGLVGQKAGGVPMYLDVHEKYHGPHGLVAGTTGSGKSETLQTYILSLAINYSPDDVGFFVIDYKGGGMANLFTGLPHLIGQISNLSGNQVRRAMVAIKSENVRRQRIFNECDVNNINSYTKLYKNGEAEIPVPHMFIIIDEFAELKREEPDFMRQLISVAQVGRSLGVHLILATQKPSGTVDDNIWSNSKFRLCLRVQDRQDSNDMLHRPDAAYITQAGRCYLQVGNDEIFELFQSGWSGAPYSEDMAANRIVTAKMLTIDGQAALEGNLMKQRHKSADSDNKKEITQLDAVVEYLNQIAEENGYNHGFQLWLPVLRTAIYIEELKNPETVWFDGEKWKEFGGVWDMSVNIGEYDDPANQYQGKVVLNIAETGHVAICGTVGTGKSTFLQTYAYVMAQSYSPEEINFYAIDFSAKMFSSFEGDPHFGGIMFEDDEEKIDKFFTMLAEIIKQRKELFKGGNYAQYVRAQGKVTIPAIVVFIDNISNFRDKTENKYDDTLIQLSKDGVGYGIMLMVTAAGFGSMELPSRMADNFKTTFCLQMTDKFAYTEIMRTMHLEVSPEVDVRGRGLAMVDGRVLEFQTALSLQADDDFKRGEAISAECKRMAEGWKGRRAKSIPEIPEKPVWQDFAQNDDTRDLIEDPRYLPFGYDSRFAVPFGIDLARTYCFIVSGKARTGKTNMLKCLMLAAQMKGGKLILFDFDNELGAFAERCGAVHITSYGEMFKCFMDLVPTIKERNQAKQELMKQGLEEEEIFNAMQKFEKIYFFADDLGELIDKVYHPDEGMDGCSGFVENITDKGVLHNMFWFGAIAPERIGDSAGRQMYINFVRDKKGIHFGGCVDAQRALDFNNIPFLERSKSLKAGIGLMSGYEGDEEENVTERVIVPQVKGQ